MKHQMWAQLWTCCREVPNALRRAVALEGGQRHAAAAAGLQAVAAGHLCGVIEDVLVLIILLSRGALCPGAG